VESCHIARLDELAAGLAGSREMIQITPQMRALVAIERVDGGNYALSLDYAGSVKSPFTAHCYVNNP
jgi:hypothetical protein